MQRQKLTKAGNLYFSLMFSLQYSSDLKLNLNHQHHRLSLLTTDPFTASLFSPPPHHRSLPLSVPSHHLPTKSQQPTPNTEPSTPPHTTDLFPLGPLSSPPPQNRNPNRFPPSSSRTTTGQHFCPPSSWPFSRDYPSKEEQWHEADRFLDSLCLCLLTGAFYCIFWWALSLSILL